MDPRAKPTTKVRIHLTVEVDKADWQRAYGTPPSEIRADVRDYVAGIVRHGAASDSGIVGVTVHDHYPKR